MNHSPPSYLAGLIPPSPYYVSPVSCFHFRAGNISNLASPCALALPLPGCLESESSEAAVSKLQERISLGRGKEGQFIFIVSKLVFLSLEQTVLANGKRLEK